MFRNTIIYVLSIIVSLFSAYDIGDIVVQDDKISWTISGPAGHPDLGKSDDMFNMIGTQLKPVMIFFGASS